MVFFGILSLRVAKILNELPTSAAMALDAKNFENQIGSEEVSRIIDKLLRYTC